MAKKSAAAEKKPAKRPRKERDPLWYIAEGLRPLAEPLDAVRLNPENAKSHNEASIAATAASMEQYGCRQPIVANKKTKIILVGNGRYQAAEKLGWSHVPVVWVTDDSKTATGYAIADNRTVQLSEWDLDRLAEQLAELKAGGDFDALADLLALDELVGPPAAEEEPPADTSPQLDGLTYQVIVTCASEEEQRELAKTLRKQGLKAKMLTV